MLCFLENIFPAKETECVGVLEGREAFAFQYNTVMMLEMYYMKGLLSPTSVIISFSGCYQLVLEP